MSRIFVGAMALFLFFGVFGPSLVEAGLKFGSGYYTNLCGSGTAAISYQCDVGCNPLSGSCVSSTDGAVRYVCTGNWNQCLENEVGWTNGVSMGQPGCGNTVQLSLYDHKCRRDDGSWDASCQLLGYMVWYSGDCLPPVAGYSTGTPIIPTATNYPAPSSKFSTPTPSVRVTSISPTIRISPTLSQTQKFCSRLCEKDSDCGIGYACSNKQCRNKDCVSDGDCICGSEKKALSPETGTPVWLKLLGVIALGYLGLKIMKIGKILW